MEGKEAHQKTKSGDTLPRIKGKVIIVKNWESVTVTQDRLLELREIYASSRFKNYMNGESDELDT